MKESHLSIVNLPVNYTEKDFDDSVSKIKRRTTEYNEYMIMVNDKNGIIRTEEEYKFKRFSPLFLMRLQKIINNCLNEMFEDK